MSPLVNLSYPQHCCSSCCCCLALQVYQLPRHPIAVPSSPPLHCFLQYCNLAHLVPLYLLLLTHSCPLLIGTSRLRGLQQSEQPEQRFQWISIFIQVIQHCHVTLSIDDTCLLILHALCSANNIISFRSLLFSSHPLLPLYL